jgi:hypothetical protein
MFFELRQYRIPNNQMEAWVRLMEEEIIPFQVSKGMVVVSSCTAPDEPDLYVWIRRFNSEEERERLYKEVYESTEWKEVISPKVGELLDRERIVVTRLEPTCRSVMH